jgi:hypothetical protein
MGEKKPEYNPNIPPFKASDLAHMISGDIIEPQRVIEILTEASRSVSGVLAQHNWDTETEQRVFNAFRAVIFYSSKIVKGR